MPGHCRRYGHARVLVVDDHRTYRLLMAALLEKLGVAHLCCADGQEALQALEDEPVDLIITDCRMPVLDGYAMTRELRRREELADGPRVPVLAFTACLGPDEIRRCMAAGMDGWLTKPIALEPLGEVLRHWLGMPDIGQDDAPTPLHNASVPTRASLIATFGDWDVVALLVSSLIQEACEDLMLLEQARAQHDASVAIQRLHRLVGSLAFLGATGLEQRAVRLISRLGVTGIDRQTRALDSFQQDIEAYLHYLAAL